MHYMTFFSKVGNIFRQPNALKLSNSMLEGNLSLTPSKLFVGGIPFNTDGDVLKEVFSKFGKVVDATVVLDRESGNSRGFGFVTFQSSDEANKAIRYLDGQEVEGRRIRVNLAESGGGGGRGGFGGGARGWR